MKTSTLILSLLISLKTFSQTYDCSTDKILSVQGGYPLNIKVEAGVQTEFIGIFVGAKFTVKNVKGNEVYPPSQQANVNPYVRINAKIFGGEDDFIRIYGTGFFGTGRIYGIGAKIGFPVSDDLMLFIEPLYTDAGKEGNLGLSFRF